jgi:hypothetical protein
MSLEKPGTLWAAAKVNGAAATFIFNRGFSAIVDTGVGDHLLTFDAQIDPSERLCVMSSSLPTAVMGQAVDTSDTQVQVLHFSDAGAAADPTSYGILVYRLIF